MSAPTLQSLIDDACVVFCGCRPLRLVPSFGAFREQTAPLPGVRPFNGGAPPEGAVLMATFQMTDSQHVELRIQATDKRGNPAQVAPNSVEWLVDKPAVVSVTPADDGMTADLAAAGPLGTFKVTVKAEVGADFVAGFMDGEIVSGAATQVSVTPGTPAEQ